MEHQIILGEYWEKPKGKNNLILHFNYLLDKKSNYFSLNESALENLLDQLDNLVLIKDVSYWLTMARINELALLCTENYANNGEIPLVGDLLLNPRLILIHVRGQNRPIVKKRHTPLTEQFGFIAETFPEVVQWLKTETFLEIKTAALLPYFHQKLEESGCFSKEYFNSLNKRKTQIVELTGFLSSAGVTDSLDLYQWLKNARPSDRELMESKLCCCNLDLFLELGRQVRDFAQGPGIPTRFQNWEFSKENVYGGHDRCGFESCAARFFFVAGGWLSLLRARLKHRKNLTRLIRWEKSWFQFFGGPGHSQFLPQWEPGRQGRL